MRWVIPRDQTSEPFHDLSPCPPFAWIDGMCGSISLQKLVRDNIHHVPHAPLSPNNSKHRIPR